MFLPEETPARLLLARHGETDWNRAGRLQGHADVPLNDLGRAQARRLAERLAGEGVQALVSSDLARAAETARIVGGALGLEPALRPEWREARPGEGADGDLVEALLRGDCGETLAQFEERVSRGFGALCREHAGRVVALVSHGGTLKVLVAWLIGLPRERAGSLSLRGDGGLSVVEFRRGRPVLALLNDTSHLEE